VGKFRLYSLMIQDRLDQGGSVCIITTDQTPETVMERASLEGIDLATPEKDGKLLFISGTGSLSGVSYKPGLNITSLSNLEDIDYNIFTASERLETPVHYFFDTFSTMFIHNQAQMLSKFYQLLSAQVKASFGSITFIVQEGMHPSEVEATLFSLSDGVVQMTFDKNMHGIYRVRYFKGLKDVTKEWLPI